MDHKIVKEVSRIVCLNNHSHRLVIIEKQEIDIVEDGGKIHELPGLSWFVTQAGAPVNKLDSDQYQIVGDSDIWRLSK